MALIEANFKKLHKEAVLPHKGTKDSAGFDFYAVETVEVKPKSTVVIPTGLAWEPKISMKDRDTKYKKLEKHGKEYPLVEEQVKILQELNEEMYSFFSNNFLVKMEMLSRSSVFSKHGVHIEGKIDQDYRGEIGIMAQNNSTRTFHVKKGDRIAQGEITLVPKVEVKEVKTLKNTIRGEGGFGSTGGVQNNE